LNSSCAICSKSLQMAWLGLVFATHEVSLRGHALPRIETTMQRMELSFLTRAAEQPALPDSEGPPLILGIVVTEAEEFKICVPSKILLAATALPQTGHPLFVWMSVICSISVVSSLLHVGQPRLSFLTSVASEFLARLNVRVLLDARRILGDRSKHR